MTDDEADALDAEHERRGLAAPGPVYLDAYRRADRAKRQAARHTDVMLAAGNMVTAQPRAANDNRPLPVIDPADWQGMPVPARQWLVPGWIPSRTVTLLYGDGGLGKSLLALQVGIATALGLTAAGLKPEPGRTLYVGAEDEADEFHRRTGDILAAEGLSFNELSGAFRLVPLADRDALLSVPDKSGVLVETTLMRQIREEVSAFRPALLILDTAADMFGGEEIKRGQVRQFIGMLRSIAIEFDCAVLLLAHPSVAGMQTGTGTSGSTAWNNSARSRLYLTAPSGGDADPDQRILTTMKSNYGPKGAELKLRWRKGLFVLDDGQRSDNPAQDLVDVLTDRTFVQMLSTLTRQGQKLSPSRSPTYAPKFIAKQPQGKGTSQRAFEDSMQRLLDAGTIQIVEDGPPSRRTRRLLVTAECFGGAP